MGSTLSEPVTANVIDRAASTGWVVACAEMQGWRRSHEDAHIVRCDTGGAREAAVFAVLDGHGGQRAATLGAELLEERLRAIAQQGAQAPEQATRLLREAFIDTDAKLRERLPAEDRSGSTVVSAIVTKVAPAEYSVQLAHAGDSRAVLCASGELFATVDHKPDRADEARRIRAAGGDVQQGPLGCGPVRVDGTLAVSRALGDFHFKPAEKSPIDCKVTPLPEVQIRRCRAGDWLLLACDGIFDVVSNEELRDFVNIRLQPAGKAEAAMEGGQIMTELLQMCLDRGSKDNCTACLVQLRAHGPAASRARELVQGPWGNAPSEVRAKYAEFFASRGFEKEARAVQAAPMPAPRISSDGSGPRSVSSADSGPGGERGARQPRTAQQIVALAKALSAMRNARGQGTGAPMPKGPTATSPRGEPGDESG